MPSRIRAVTFDCADPYALASWWSDVVDAPVHAEDAPGDPEAAVLLSVGPWLLFEQVEEQKFVKNRVHLDLEPDGPRDLEVHRLLELGATMVADRRHADGAGWAVLADPEGNEFCVLRSAAERETTAAPPGVRSPPGQP